MSIVDILICIGIATVITLIMMPALEWAKREDARKRRDKRREEGRQ